MGDAICKMVTERVKALVEETEALVGGECKRLAEAAGGARSAAATLEQAATAGERADDVGGALAATARLRAEVEKVLEDRSLHVKVAEGGLALAGMGEAGKAVASLAQQLQVSMTGGAGLQAKDEAKAAQLFRQAAEKGHAHAAFNLGMCARHGRGMERNDSAAAGAWVSARVWERVTHVVVSRQNGSEWLQKRATPLPSATMACAWRAVGEWSRTRPPRQKYRRAAEQGDPFACYNLGHMLAGGAASPRRRHADNPPSQAVECRAMAAARPS